MGKNTQYAIGAVLVVVMSGLSLWPRQAARSTTAEPSSGAQQIAAEATRQVEHVRVQPGSVSAPAAQAPAPAPAADLEPVATFSRADPALDDPRGELHLRARTYLEANPAALESTLRSLRTDTDPDVHARKLVLLAELSSDRIMAEAKRLAASGDARERFDGFSLLQLDATAEARDVLVAALDNEQEPAALSAAVAALQAQPSLPSDVQGHAVERLQALQGHADLRVRAAAYTTLQGLANEPTAPQGAVRGLNDPAPEVVEATISSLGADSARAPEVKSELLGLTTNADATRELRAQAGAALRDAPLDAAERELLERDLARLERAAP